MNFGMVPAPAPVIDNIKDLNITGSHEEFWTFSQVSQWGTHWRYSSSEQDHLQPVLNTVIKARQLGRDFNCKPRLIHYAQLLIWRFYNKEKLSDYPPHLILPLAFDCAAQILEVDSPRQGIAQKINQGNGQIDPKTRNMTEFKLHFALVTSLDFNIRIHHPSEYITQFINEKFTPEEMQLAEMIISDSFLIPCCLVHRPCTIAEGAAIMAAGMLDRPDSVIPKTSKALSFIQDMKCFYKQKLKR